MVDFLSALFCQPVAFDLGGFPGDEFPVVELADDDGRQVLHSILFNQFLAEIYKK
jgi:hypothetical protein